MLEVMRTRPGREDELVRLPELPIVMNFTGQVVRILDGYGNVLVHEGTPMEYRCDGSVKLKRASDAEVTWPDLNDYEIAGLPEPVAGMNYLVNWEVAEQAKRLGRRLDDLLMPMQPYFSDDGKSLTLVGYGEIVSAADWAWCFL